MTCPDNTTQRFFTLATLLSMGGGRDTPIPPPPLSVLTRRPRLSEFSAAAPPPRRGVLAVTAEQITNRRLIYTHTHRTYSYATVEFRHGEIGSCHRSRGDCSTVPREGRWDRGWDTRPRRRRSSRRDVRRRRICWRVRFSAASVRFRRERVEPSTWRAEWVRQLPTDCYINPDCSTCKSCWSR